MEGRSTIMNGGHVRANFVPIAVAYAVLSMFHTAPIWFWTSEAVAETLRVARSAGPPGLGNPFTSVAQPASGVWSMVFDSLTLFENDRTLQPGLALSWHSTSDTTWEFSLRPGVVYHNGRALDATAVADAIGILLTEEARSYYVYPNFHSLEAVRVIDEMTIEITTNRPDPILPRRLSLLMIVEPNAWHAMGPTGFAQSPIGSGPYRLEEWGRGNSKIVLTAFSQSWRSAAHVQEIEMLIMPDSVTRSQALLSGAVDIVEAAGSTFGLSTRPDLKSHLHSESQVYMLAYRLVGNDGSPLLDRRVREALSYTVNRQAIADVIFEGSVEPANQPITPEIIGYNSTLPDIPYNPERARSLLSEAGYADGFDLDVVYTNNSTEESRQMLQLIAQDMAQVGVRMNLESNTIQNFFYKWQSGDWGDTDLFLAISDGSIFFDAVRPLWMLSCDKPNPWVCNEETTQKLRQISGVMDVDLRTARLEALVADVVADHPAIWLTSISSRTLATTRVGKLPVRPDGIAFEKIKLE